MTERIGFWIDLDDAYYTLTNEYIESVWWILRRIYDKGLLYQGFKVVPYCPRCGTAISSHEVAQGYKDVTEDSVYLRLRLTAPAAEKLTGAPGVPVSLAVWTTTPWTLISNVAAAVHPDVTLRPRREPRRALRPRPRPRREGARQEGRRRARAARRRAAGSRLRGAVRLHARGEARPLRHRRRLRDDDRRHRHRPHRPRLRRGGHGGRARQRPPGRQRRRHRGPLRGRGDAVGRAVRQGRRPGHHRRPQGARPAARRRGVRAQLPVLLALRHAPAQLLQADVVRPHDGDQGPAPRRQRRRRLAPRAHQDRALRRVAGEQRRLGPGPRPLLGHAAARLALRGGAHALRGVDRRAARDGGRAGAGRPRAAPALRRRRRPALPRVRRRDAPRGRGHRRLVRLGLDALRPVALPVRERGPLPRALPGRLHLSKRSTRRGAGSTASSPSPPSSRGAARTSAACASGTSSTARARR